MLHLVNPPAGRPGRAPRARCAAHAWRADSASSGACTRRVAMASRRSARADGEPAGPTGGDRRAVSLIMHAGQRVRPRIPGCCSPIRRRPRPSACLQPRACVLREHVQLDRHVGECSVRSHLPNPVDRPLLLHAEHEPACRAPPVSGGRPPCHLPACATPAGHRYRSRRMTSPSRSLLGTIPFSPASSATRARRPSHRLMQSRPTTSHAAPAAVATRTKSGAPAITIRDLRQRVRVRSLPRVRPDLPAQPAGAAHARHHLSALVLPLRRVSRTGHHAPACGGAGRPRTDVATTASPGATVMEVGCGEGQLLQAIKADGDPSWRVVGVDISEDACEALRRPDSRCGVRSSRSWTGPKRRWTS